MTVCRCSGTAPASPLPGVERTGEPGGRFLYSLEVEHHGPREKSASGTYLAVTAVSLRRWFRLGVTWATRRVDTRDVVLRRISPVVLSWFPGAWPLGSAKAPYSSATVVTVRIEPDHFVVAGQLHRARHDGHGDLLGRSPRPTGAIDRPRDPYRPPMASATLVTRGPADAACSGASR